MAYWSRKKKPYLLFWTIILSFFYFKILYISFSTLILFVTTITAFHFYYFSNNLDFCCHPCINLDIIYSCSNLDIYYISYINLDINYFYSNLDTYCHFYIDLDITYFYINLDTCCYSYINSDITFYTLVLAFSKEKILYIFQSSCLIAGLQKKTNYISALF